MDEFTEAYLRAALWSSTDETNPESGGDPLDNNYSIDDIDAETLVEMALDCHEFQSSIKHISFLRRVCRFVSPWVTGGHIDDVNVNVESPEYSCHARAGHDFWLTRNGHGAGFWDGDWKEPAATFLTKASQEFGEFNITATGHGGKVSKM